MLLHIVHLSSLNSSPEYFLPAPLLHPGVEGEVEQRPLEGGGGGLRPRPEHVVQRHRQVLKGQCFIVTLAHANQVDINEVSWIHLI